MQLSLEAMNVLRKQDYKACFKVSFFTCNLTTQLETSATKIKKKEPTHRTLQILNNKTTDCWSKNKNIEIFSDLVLTMTCEGIITGQLIYYIVHKISVVRICFQKHFK